MIAGAFSIYFWQEGSLQSRILRGFVSNLLLQVSHKSFALDLKYPLSVSIYFGLQFLHPTEFIFTERSESPSLSIIWTERDITSASRAGSFDPNTSTPD